MPIVYLDAEDGSGKSTLAKKIMATSPRSHYLHCTYRHKDKMFTYHTAALWRAVKLSRDHMVVIDRQWLSEYVYAAIYRGGSRWPHEGRFMDRVLQRYGGLTIFCSDSPEVAAARHARLKTERREFFDDRIDQVAELFQRIWHGDPTNLPPGYGRDLALLGGAKSRRDFMHYSISDDGHRLDTVVNQVISRLQSIQPPMVDTPTHNLLGSLKTATYLFVGDKVRPKSRCLRWPFYDYGHSSLYLVEACSAINLDETKVAWTNVGELGDMPVIQHALSLKPELKLIALGNTASRYLHRLGIEHRKIHHPQYAKRFTRVNYGQLLLEAMS